MTQLIKKHKFPDNFVLVIDEVHQSSTENQIICIAANIAINYGLLKKVVVMSATHGINRFENTAVAKIDADGRVYNITDNYNEYDIDENNPKSIRESVLNKIFHVRSKNINKKKNILVFVPGSSDVEQIVSTLQRSYDCCNGLIQVYGLHRESDDESVENATRQLEINEPTRIIIATNIAESSITIPGTHIVIDSCIHKVAYEANSIVTLKTEFASKDKLTQRRGRCGRQCEGEYYPLITKDKWDSLPANDLSDLERISPYNFVIDIVKLGLDPKKYLMLE